MLIFNIFMLETNIFCKKLTYFCINIFIFHKIGFISRNFSKIDKMYGRAHIAQCRRVFVHCARF